MIFETRDVSFHYAEAEALSSVSLAIEEKQRVALLGANGSGKSTMLRLLNGLSLPSAGKVLFRARELTEDALADAEFAFEFRRAVALVFQNPDVQLFNPTVYDEVAFAPLQMRKSEAEIRQSVDAMLEQFQIKHLKDRAPHRLSGGEKKRVALASALVLDPEVLMLDEPTAALDPESQSAMLEFLLDCRGKKTVITATHNLDILGEIADYCFLLKAGGLAAQGTPEEILRDETLLRETHLLRSHRHRHGSVVHSHPHVHQHHLHGYKGPVTSSDQAGQL